MITILLCASFLATLAESNSPFPAVEKKLAAHREVVLSNEPIFLNLSIRRTEDIGVLRYWLGSYEKHNTYGYSFELMQLSENGKFAEAYYKRPLYSESPILVRDNQGNSVEKLPLNLTVSRTDILILPSPGEYKVRGLVNNTYQHEKQGVDGPIRERVIIKDWTNWVTVSVRAPEEMGQDVLHIPEALREALPERLFDYYYHRARGIEL